MPYQKAVIDQRGAEVNVGRASERRDKSAAASRMPNRSGMSAGQNQGRLAIMPAPRSLVRRTRMFL